MRRRDFLRQTAAAGAGLALRPLLPHLVPGRDAAAHGVLDLNPDWQFVLADPDGAQAPAFDDAAWTRVTLPHTARVEDVVTGPPGSETYQWQGVCWYRRRLPLGPEAAGKRVYLMFEGAMNVADVWLDGHPLGRHLGGYLPFGFDVTAHVRPGAEHVVAVRLDNRDDPVTGPKPLAQLDFNPYGGLYRDVYLVVKDPLHVTDPILAGKPASGGVFVRFPEVSAERAVVWVQAHVRNDGDGPRRFAVHTTLRDAGGRVVAQAFSEATELAAGADTEVVQTLDVLRPALWSPKAPHLHTVHTEVVAAGRVVDARVTRVGIRRIALSQDGFAINGEQLFLRGTNRHQEYPYVGYAVPDAAQYRDAKKIKDAGFDYVRLSHYPHDPAFMDACDALGLVVMDCLPGWQYFNREDPAFAEHQYQNTRDLIRRDRNHPCVVLWEVSLNESWMPDDFIQQTHALAHEEYPGDQLYTCGWQQGYDVFIQARQHGGCTETTGLPCVVSEYGDWEYYAQNAGLHQEAWQDLNPAQQNSRQLRWHGERALLQQATNFQEAHNDNRKTIAFADGLWVMFDYNRGYAPDIESSGCMDLFRLPKFSYYFFQSQRDPGEGGAALMVFIASYWTPASPARVRVFSNGDEVALHLNGRLVARQGPDRDRLSTHLAHPPFTFDVGRFEAGTLEAVAYRGGVAAARHVVRTPGAAARLALHVDLEDRPLAVEGKDVAFVHAFVEDADGTVVPDAWENVFFGATGDVALVGRNPFSSEAGVASIVLQSDGRRPQGAVYALSVVRAADGVRLLSAAAPAGGDALPYAVRYTTDGRVPGPDAAPYTGPFAAAGPVRAALFVEGRAVVVADDATPTFRVPGSTPPEPQR